MTIDWLWAALLLPLVGASLNGLVGQRMGKTFTTAVAVGSVWLSFFIALGILLGHPFNPSPITASQANAYPDLQAPFYWFDAGALRLKVGLLLDPLSAIMLLIVTGVGALIHTYSIGYMHDDAGYNRYFTYLNLFTFSMLILVLADSFLVMFVGWELVGLCSYLLIGFWYQRDSATNAGKKAFIVNRVGDWAFVIGVILTFIAFAPLLQGGDSLRFQPIFSYLAGAAPALANAARHAPPAPTLVPLIALLLFIGATGKSAQLPLLHIWLPDAMEGPTPVSALIHAATMVTAGVYMVARCHDFFLLSPDVMKLIAWIGVITAFVAATTAVVQTDIKRVLAYSTISQLGFMFIGAGVGAFTFSIFHLMTHAFFKALLFLGSGAVIHALHNEQDMRNMGGLQKRIPQVGILMGIGVLAISGLPPLSGFWSKDSILGAAAGQSILLWLLGTLTSFLTAFYMTRLWMMTFYGEEHWQGAPTHATSAHDDISDEVSTTEPESRVSAGKGDGGSRSARRREARAGQGKAPAAVRPATRPAERPAAHSTDLHPTPLSMLAPMAVLAVLSIIAGAALLGNALPGFLDPVFRDMRPAAPEGHAFAPELALMIIAALVSVAGIAAGFVMYRQSNVEPKPWMQQRRSVVEFLLNAWNIDLAAHWIFARKGEHAARLAYRDLEVRGIDRGMDGMARGVQRSGRELRIVQSGVVGDYALAMAFGVACMVMYFLLR